MSSYVSLKKFTALFLLSVLNFAPLYSAFADVPRDKLMIEYMFNGGIADTSGNANTVVNVGTTFGTDSVGPINYVSFSGTTQTVGLSGWTSGVSAITISFWIKTPLSGRGTASQYIFSTQRSSTTAATGLMLDSNYRCTFGTWKIDCAQLKDEKWHHILMRKDDYGDSYFYLDGALLDRSSGVAIDRSITLGGTIGVSTFVGKLGAFRIYRGDVNQTVMDSLYDEFPLLHAGIVVDPQKPIITITEPSTDSASFKKITATANLGTLEMYVQDPTTTSPACDSSVSNSKFEAYSQLLFNNATDNGTRICYRATNGANVTYKFSNRIYGISTESAIISTENIFSDNAYLAWTSSRKKNPADFMFNIIDRIASQGVSFVDINGDGLIDTLYADNNYKALLVNNGDYTFRVAYKCYFNSVTKDYYYGDCANTSYKN